MKKEYYYSNCLIEAIKAKLKDWKNVKIHHTSIFENIKRYDVYCSHFWWEKNGLRYDFHTPETLLFPHWLWWKGRIRVTNLHK